VKAAESGLDTKPQVIAELGPGDSLGTGIAALLSGASKYYALDFISHVTAERNVQMLHELAELFGRRADIPDEAEFPTVIPKLKSYRFPERWQNGSPDGRSYPKRREGDPNLDLDGIWVEIEVSTGRGRGRPISVVDRKVRPVGCDEGCQGRPCGHARAEQQGQRPPAPIVPSAQCQPDDMRTGDWENFESQWPRGITPSGTGPFRVHCARI
jgi:hypothetical protein